MGTDPAIKKPDHIVQMKPAQDKQSNPIIKFFAYQHFPEPLKEVSKEFGDLAYKMNDLIIDSAEKSAGLRKLLEAKDCFVRARLSQ